MEGKGINKNKRGTQIKLQSLTGLFADVGHVSTAWVVVPPAPAQQAGTVLTSGIIGLTCRNEHSIKQQQQQQQR